MISPTIPPTLSRTRFRFAPLMRRPGLDLIEREIGGPRRQEATAN